MMVGKASNVREDSFTYLALSFFDTETAQRELCGYRD